MTSSLTITDLPIPGKRVLMRVDFNVPLDEKGMITDDTRIRAALPSIQYVIDRGGSIVLMSHLGRPKGEKNQAFSLAPVAKRLSELLGREVLLAPDCVGNTVEELAASLKPGHVLLLENLRFYKGEEKPESDPSFAVRLGSLGDLYVNDAFGTAHRAHASTTTVARFFPGAAAAGFLMEKEIEFLGGTFAKPQRPFVALIGGAKISTKLGVLHALLKKVDTMLIGGGMSYTFLKAHGVSIGNSLVEDASLEAARALLGKVLLPVDLVVTNGKEIRLISVAQGIPDGFEGVDIGPQTIELFTTQLKRAKTVFWNGPVGVFEKPEFAVGTQAMAQVLAALDATTIVGGGDSVAAVVQAGLVDRMSHISTGGGASLEYIELGTLPGIEALSRKP